MSARDTTADAERPSSNGLLLALAALIWMAAMLWSARASITGRANAEMEVTSTAYALPGAVSASLVTGAAAGLAVLALILRRRPLGSTARFAVSTGVGLTVGLLGALTIITINAEGWLYAVVGGTIAAATTIGGALAGFRIPRVTTAVCWAAIGVFLVGFALNLFQGPLLGALGAGDTQASRAGAAQWFSFCQSVLSGLAAGLISYAVLRRTRRTAGVDFTWPWYALAGAGAGLLLVIGEGLTRSAGARVLDLAGKISELELLVQQMLSSARLNSALIVLFAGAISAVIAIGRTIRPTDEAGPANPDDQAGPTHPTEQTGTTHPTDQAGTTHPTDQAGTTHPTDQAGTTRQDEAAGGTAPAPPAEASQATA